MPFQIVHNDITKMETDAIVNAANSRLLMGGGVCGAIFSAAGPRKLQKACNQYGYCKIGGAVITEGFDLPAKYVIHAVGPVWQGGNANEEALLEAAYRSSLQLARKHQCTSISFPLISSGIYGYPKEQALKVAVSVISEFVLMYDMDVYLVVFDRRAVCLSNQLFTEINHYIDYYHEDTGDYSRRLREEPMMVREGAADSREFPPKLDELLGEVGETFSQMLMRLVKEKGVLEVDVYKRANMDRKLFSKIKNNRDYQPKKKTALSLAVALQLSVEETENLLRKAGFSLTNSSKMDVIVRYFLEKEEYDIFAINEALFYYEQPILGN